ncbi:MAG: GrpB family protein [Chlamydiae bacterium]|nr:GrpB family protein [Chlamydiota bacterium]
MQKYVFTNYHEIFPTLFALEKERLASLLPYAEVAHVGSSAVPGLGGKGMIDIAIQVPEKAILSALDTLKSLSYIEKAGVFSSHFFLYQDLPDPIQNIRRYHVHLLPEGHSEWLRFLRFRDFLRAHPDACRQYEEIKKEGVVQAEGNGVIYREHKARWLQEIFKQLEIPS